VADHLLATLQRRDAQAWTRFQAEAQKLKLRRSRLESLRQELLAASAASAPSAYALSSEESSEDEAASNAARQAMRAAGRTGNVNVVLITGFESFNQRLYVQAARKVRT
jgi:hypothetical protein